MVVGWTGGAVVSLRYPSVTTEFVYLRPDGTSEVRARRTTGTAEELELLAEYSNLRILRGDPCRWRLQYKGLASKRRVLLKHFDRDRTIRRLAKDGRSQVSLAEQFDVSRQRINQILSMDSDYE